MKGKKSYILVLFAVLMSVLMTACVTTGSTKKTAKVVGPPSVAAADQAPLPPAAPPVQGEGAVLKDVKLVQPVDVRVGSAVESRDPLRIETLTGNGTVVAPVDVDVTVPGPEYWKYGAVIVGSAAIIGLGILAADSARMFDYKTELVGAKPAR